MNLLKVGEPPMFFFNTHVPEFCYDQDFTALKPEDILG